MLNHYSYQTENNLTVLLHQLCRERRRCGMVIQCFPELVEDIEEWGKAAPWLDSRSLSMMFLGESFLFVFFNSYEEMLEAYNQTVTVSSGPTEQNPYDGPCRFRAVMNSQFRQ